MNVTVPAPFIEAEDLSLLKGRHVYLQFLTEEHRETLRPLARDERIWEFTKTLLITDTFDRQFDNYFDEALAFAAKGDRAFAIVACGDGEVMGDGGLMGADRVIGMTRAYDIDRKVKKITIGHTWYIPAVWGKAHNKECKLLLLQYIFDTLGFVRTDFKVAGQNIRSQKAVEKIGGMREGILRRYTLRNDGTPADTVFFSILAEEWPERKRRLREMVDGAMG
ncbi:MAG TPA: GNAT family protein [Puia sp.]|jgi:RimJ/RimL family protein N-acetyltransferase|nr:GNAT family protein [Puia sp.]